MEFIYTIHFLVTVLAFFSMMSKDFRVVGGIIFILHVTNYLVLNLASEELFKSRYGIIPILFGMDLLVTVILLKIHKDFKDVFSLKILVVMYFYAVAHFLNFLNLFIRWEVKTLSIYWGDLTQLVVVCKMYHNAYDEIIFGLTFILALLFISSGIGGFIGTINKFRHFWNSGCDLGTVHGFTDTPWLSNLDESERSERKS